MNYRPLGHESEEIRSMRFQIERIAQQATVSNIEIDVYRQQAFDGIVIEMTRRLAVCRSTFEGPEPDKVERGQLEIDTSYAVYASWWDHAKATVRTLTWLCSKGILSMPAMKAVPRFRTADFDKTHKHYTNLAVVLNDREQLPEAVRDIEVRYRTEL